MLKIARTCFDNWSQFYQFRPEFLKIYFKKFCPRIYKFEIEKISDENSDRTWSIKSTPVTSGSWRVTTEAPPVDDDLRFEAAEDQEGARQQEGDDPFLTEPCSF
jgi:hypothetical protein